MKDYVISEKTLLISPYNRNMSKVYEKDTVKIVNLMPKEIISQNCIYNGSSYEGRVKATNFYLHTAYKAPIVISEKKKLIFFPTASVKSKECYWVNYNAINRFLYNDEIIQIEFYDVKKINIKMSIHVFNNQILKSARLSTIINQQ